MAFNGMNSSAHTPADVSRLHAEFAALTGRREHIRFHERSWDYLLGEFYQGNVDTMMADLRLIVRYLKKQLGIQKRNPGCLKLLNFLQPDRWDADLNEARTMFPPVTRRTVPTIATMPVVEPERNPELSAGLRDLRQSLRGGRR